MTPPALTPAARRAPTLAPRPARTATGQPAPRPARAVSDRAPVLELARRRRRAHPARQRLGRRQRLLSVARALPDHPLLDRLIRGRIWIPLLGLLLAGIVAMQVEVLKYGASIGDAVANTTALQSRHQVLQASVARLSSAARIERLASRLGMVMPLAGEQAFVRFSAGDVGRALAHIGPTDAASFATATASVISQAAASAALMPNGLGAASAGGSGVVSAAAASAGGAGAG